MASLGHIKQRDGDFCLDFFLKCCHKELRPIDATGVQVPPTANISTSVQRRF